MTAAKVKATILRLTGCSGQASDDVTAYPGEHERRIKTTSTPRSRWPTASDKATTMMTTEKLGCRRPSRSIGTQSLWSSSDNKVQKVAKDETVSQQHWRQADDAHDVAEAKKTATCTAATEETSKKAVATQCMGLRDRDEHTPSLRRTRSR